MKEEMKTPNRVVVAIVENTHDGWLVLAYLFMLGLGLSLATSVKSLIYTGLGMLGIATTWLIIYFIARCRYKGQ